MPNSLTIFKNNEFGSVRVMEINGEPWFVGRDVAGVLGYAKPQNAISTHVDDDDREIAKCDTPGGKQDMLIINESGLYSLVFSSKLPTAKAFKKWVTSEVLPSVRKTETYSMKPLSQLEIAKMSLDMLIEQERRLNAIEEETKNTREQIKEINAKMETRVQDCYSIAGYASLRGIKLDVNKANMLGRLATKLSHEYGYDISRTPDPRFGTVNVYHADILKSVFEKL